MRNCDLPCLMTALLGIRHLVLHLDTACSSLDHLLGKKVRGFLIAKPSINISNNGDNVCFKIINLFNDPLLSCFVILFHRNVELPEELVQLTSVGLAKESVDLLDKCRDCSLLMHGLVRKRSKFRSHCCNHPARKIKIALVCGAKVLLDGYHLLLGNKPVPAPKGLGVRGGVQVVLSHVLPHDLGCVLGNIHPSLELVLELHPGHVLWLDGTPLLLISEDARGLINAFLIVGHVGGSQLDVSTVSSSH